jgi:hypothetical protein
MSLYELASLIVANKRLWSFMFASVLGVALLLCFILPKRYISSFTILPKTSSRNAFLEIVTSENVWIGWTDWVIPGVMQSPRFLLEVMKRRFPVRKDGCFSEISISDVANEREEAKLLEAAGRYIRVQTDEMSGAIRLIVETPYPELSHRAASLALEELVGYVTEQRSQMREAYGAYYASRITEARNGLILVERELSDFLGRNRAWMESDDPGESLEQDRLRRKQTIFADVYGELRKQSQLDDIKVLSLLPPLEILDYPEIATLKSFPRRKVILLLGGFAALFLSFLAVVVVEGAQRFRIASGMLP